MKIVNGIVDTAIQKIIPIANNKARPRYPMTAEFITIHNTANAGVTAKQNADYVVSQNEYKSWHFTVGNNEVYQHLPITESAWHSGDGEHGYGNRKSIGIEIAEVYGADRTAVKFVAELIKATGISIDKIVSHKHWSGKNCPRLILPHWDSLIGDIKAELGGEEVKFEVQYREYKNGMTELEGHPSKLGIEVVDKYIWHITEFTNCVNGPFFGHHPDGSTYSASILYENGVTYQSVANHYKDFGTPQDVFIVYKNDDVEIKTITFLSELNLSKIRLVIGGIALRNTKDPNFKYEPEKRGFKKGFNLKGIWKDFTDVFRKTNKTVVGYNIKYKTCFLLTVPNVTHDELIKLISTGDKQFHLCLSVDGGGSSFMDALWRYVFYGSNFRRIHSIIRFRP